MKEKRRDGMSVGGEVSDNMRMAGGGGWGGGGRGELVGEAGVARGGAPMMMNEDAARIENEAKCGEQKTAERLHAGRE